MPKSKHFEIKRGEVRTVKSSLPLNLDYYTTHTVIQIKQ